MRGPDGASKAVKGISGLRRMSEEEGRFRLDSIACPLLLRQLLLLPAEEHRLRSG